MPLVHKSASLPALPLPSAAAAEPVGQYSEAGESSPREVPASREVYTSAPALPFHHDLHHYNNNITITNTNSDTLIDVRVENAEGNYPSPTLRAAVYTKGAEGEEEEEEAAGFHSSSHSSLQAVHHGEHKAYQGTFGPVQRLFHTLVPPGGHVSNIFNKASGTVSIGVVSMASGFNSTGVVLAAILMVVCGLLIVYSYYLLGVTAERTGVRSWEEAARKILFRGADYMVAGTLAFYTFGAMTGFVVVTHDLLGPFVDDASVNPFLRSNNGRRILAAIVWLFGMLSLSLPRRVASLRYFSIIGICLILLFTVAIIYKSCVHGLPHLHEMHLFSSGLDAINGLTLFIFAFMDYGLCFKIFAEMPKPSAVNLAIAGAGSVGMVAVLYYIVGFFGYADLGLVVTGSVFQYYNVRDDVFMMIVYLGLMLKVCIGYALCLQACRLPIYYMIHRNIDAVPFWQHALITIAICLVSFILGIFIPDINIVFNLLGSICGGILAFLLPAYFVMYIGGWTVAKVGWFHVGMTYLNILAGVVSIVFGTVMAVNNVVVQYG